MTLEYRAGSPVSVKKENDTIKVSGYAAVFDSPAEIMDIDGPFIEKIQRGAFSEAVGRDDVVFLVNHAGLPLARTKSGTLKLTEDDHGLKIETELDPRDPDVQSIQIKMDRGDLDKMSFAFYTDAEDWNYDKTPNERTVTKARLEDVSIVNFPAYNTTEIGIRSLSRNSQPKQSIDVIKTRMRMNLALAK